MPRMREVTKDNGGRILGRNVEERTGGHKGKG